ncbi:MAG TPA: transporter [Puia sp.]|jgi:hypothetical protein|nr:transporter [Puia sp.]
MPGSIYNLLQRSAGILTSLLFLTVAENTTAQAPRLPATNLGLANIGDGITPGPGIYYVDFTQDFQGTAWKDGLGHNIPTHLRVNSFVTVHQFIYVSRVKVFSGYLAYTALIPIARISATDNSAPPPTVNPNVLGDIILGPAIVWQNKRFLGMPLFHRAEVDLIIPTGSYKSRYEINPGAHLYTLSVHYTYTWYLTKDFSVSMRNHLDYNTKILGTEAKPGMFYHLNYSFEQTIYKNFRAEVCGYYLSQVQQDSYNGNYHYYQEKYGIPDTRERVFAYGPGFSFLANKRLLIEGKAFVETAVKNREKGVRSALQLAYKFN